MTRYQAKDYGASIFGAECTIDFSVSLFATEDITENGQSILIPNLMWTYKIDGRIYSNTFMNNIFVIHTQ